MKVRKIKCPFCGCPDALEDSDEVDVGVGVISNVIGGECPNCGEFGFTSCCRHPWKRVDGPSCSATCLGWSPYQGGV